MFVVKSRRGTTHWCMVPGFKKFGGPGPVIAAPMLAVDSACTKYIRVTQRANELVLSDGVRLAVRGWVMI